VKALAWGRLLRLSLAPSAAADVAAGLTLAAGGWFPGGRASWLLIAASVSVYTGSLALNDWADREHDGRTRGDRPIPSGSVSPNGALALAIGLQLLAIALAFLAATESGWLVTGIAVAASFYNLKGRGPLLGPLLLGLCRAANLASGMVLVSGGLLPGHTLVCVLYGAYVYLASRLGRMEDAEDALGPRARLYVFGAGSLFIALPLAAHLQLPGLPLELGWTLALAIAVLAGGDLLARALFGRLESRGDVQRTMGVLLRRLLVFTAIVAVIALPMDAPLDPETGLRVEGAEGLVVAALILSGYPLSFFLRKVFPPS
jgi:4-hydroxybenzoate polyprenyltransferase